MRIKFVIYGFILSISIINGVSSNPVEVEQNKFQFNNIILTFSDVYQMEIFAALLCIDNCVHFPSFVFLSFPNLYAYSSLYI